MDSGKLIEIRTYGQKFTNSPNEKFLLMILGSQAKLENDNKVVNVNVHRYVYYGCCRFQDKNCPSGYLREDALIEQLANLMDKIDLDEIGMKERIKAEIERHKKFQSGILGIKGQSVKVGDVDVRNYAKYVLRDGTIFEKRELLTCLRSKITMAKKEVKIA